MFNTGVGSFVSPQDFAGPFSQFCKRSFSFHPKLPRSLWLPFWKRREWSLPVYAHISYGRTHDWNCFGSFCFANLRCKVRNIISCSDASEHGGAAAEASRFGSALSPETCTFADDWKSPLAEESYNIHVHKSKDALCVCTQCGGENPAFERWACCPRKCGVLPCAIRCLQVHCNSDCCFNDPGFTKFGEGFSGPNAPLTWAHSCEGICVLTPFGKLFGCKADFFSPSGGELFMEFDNEEVFVEHWGPDCKLQ